MQAATQHSACVDIPCPKDMELLMINSPYKINTGYYGLIPSQTMGLILDRSSCTMQVLTVMTRVIDEDYIGEVSVTVQVTQNLYLQKGDRFAQLLLLPYIKPQKTSTTARTGGGGRFGSTNIPAGLSTLLHELKKPLLRLNIWGKKFEGMLDTGADISIIRHPERPPEWPIQSASNRIIGVGEANSLTTFESVSYLQAHGPDQITVYIKPEVPINLWS